MSSVSDLTLLIELSIVTLSENELLCKIVYKCGKVFHTLSGTHDFTSFFYLFRDPLYTPLGLSLNNMLAHVCFLTHSIIRCENFAVHCPVIRSFLY